MKKLEAKDFAAVSNAGETGKIQFYKERYFYIY